VCSEYLALQNVVLLFEGAELFPVQHPHLLQSQVNVSLLLAQVVSLLLVQVVSLLLAQVVSLLLVQVVSLLLAQLVSLLVDQSLNNRALLNLQRDRETETDRQRDRDIETDRDRQRDRDRDRQRERQTDRQTERQRQRRTETERETESTALEPYSAIKSSLTPLWYTRSDSYVSLRGPLGSCGRVFVSVDIPGRRGNLRTASRDLPLEEGLDGRHQVLARTRPGVCKRTR